MNRISPLPVLVPFTWYNTYEAQKQRSTHNVIHLTAENKSLVNIVICKNLYFSLSCVNPTLTESPFFFFSHFTFSLYIYLSVSNAQTRMAMISDRGYRNTTPDRIRYSPRIVTASFTLAATLLFALSFLFFSSFYDSSDLNSVSLSPFRLGFL